MTGPNNFIDKNPDNEENQFKNLSHEDEMLPTYQLVTHIRPDL